MSSSVERQTQPSSYYLIPSTPDRQAQERVRKATGNSSLRVTCQVRLDVLGCDDDDDTSSPWRLTSLDEYGSPKSIGGDEFYVEYREAIKDKEVVIVDETSPVPPAPHLMAVAFVTDCHDGSYQLQFSTTPTYPDLPPEDNEKHDDERSSHQIIRTLTIYFEYSNGIGTMAPPSKSAWENGGYTHTKYTITVKERPPRIRKFECLHPTSSPNLRQFDTVICFGDSTMDQFVRQRPNKKGKYYFQPNLIVGEKIRMGLNSETLEEMLDTLHQELGSLLHHELLSSSDQQQEGQQHGTALVLCSGLWDILDSQDTLQGESYDNHIQACRDYVERIRDKYPNVTIIWKSPMAVHVHVVDLNRLIDAETGKPVLFGIDRLRYMSRSRSRYLYEIQMALMEELNVPVLDIYDATYLSAHRLYPSDGRHYRPDLNRLMLNWFYR
jgi:lysophospholipase L1-like esterase